MKTSLCTEPRRSVVTGVVALLRMSRAFHRLGTQLQNVAEGAALTALSAEELQKVTNACFAKYLSPRRDDLFDWEEPWLVRDLPAPPSTLLVGGAGHGRELSWLLAQGYTVAAFDPVAKPGSRVLRASYQDLLRDQSPAVTRLGAHRPFDAMLLGWGSLTCVADPALRRALLRQLRQWSEGPLLLSCWAERQRTSTPASTSRQLGEHLGQRFGRSPDAVDRSRDRLTAHGGYGHIFTESELKQLADDAGYDAQLYWDGFPHATLWPSHRVPGQRHR